MSDEWIIVALQYGRNAIIRNCCAPVRLASSWSRGGVAGDGTTGVVYTLDASRRIADKK